MAEKAEEAASQNILCPLCLDVFDNASILICGHTFCKQCLERYTVKKNLFIGNFYVFFPCRIYLKTLVLPLTH